MTKAAEASAAAMTLKGRRSLANESDPAPKSNHSDWDNVKPQDFA